MTGDRQIDKKLPSSEAINLLLPYIRQDTSSLQVLSDSSAINPLITASDSIKPVIRITRKFTTDEIDSIFRITDSKQQLIDSAVTSKKTVRKLQTDQGRPDSSEMAKVPYRLHNTVNELNTPSDFFQTLKTDYFCILDTGQAVFLEDISINGSSEGTTVSVKHEKNDEKYFPGRYKQNPDWLLMLFIVLLIIIAWLKLFYNKFFDQTLQSVFNYQLSTKVLRDQNIFSRRVALILNLNFIFTGGIFFFLVFNYFGYSILSDTEIGRYLIFCGIIGALLLARYVVTHVTGMIFDRSDLFKEYIHQILLTYKSIGIYLIPLVIGIAYITADLKIYLIYSGLALFIIAYLWRFLKGLQIINNKDIIIFYLILYLCILEFLPVLVAYRFVTDLL